MDSSTDEQLVLKIKDGDKAAFEQIYWRYKDRIIGIVYGIVRNREDAYELAQEVFVRIYQHIDKYQPGTNFSTWAFRIANNLAIDKYRRKRTAAETEFDNDFQANYASDDGMITPPIGLNPERACECAELREKIAAALDTLSEKQRAALTLCDIDGLSYKEIADILNIQIGTVMSRLHYARINLLSRKQRHQIEKVKIRTATAYEWFSHHRQAIRAVVIRRVASAQQKIFAQASQH